MFSKYIFSGEINNECQNQKSNICPTDHPRVCSYRNVFLQYVRIFKGKTLLYYGDTGNDRISTYSHTGADSGSANLGCVYIFLA